jgi:prepilin-type N-terminal cleavage/methylation domain-containing protein
VLKSSGVSLLELLISLSISGILILAFFALVGQHQATLWTLALLEERNSNLALAPLLLPKWVSAAGNNRSIASTGIAKDGETLHVKSDLEGPSGFPDGQLAHSYEAIAIRRNGSDLQLRCNGGTFQPVIKNVSNFQSDVAGCPLIAISLAGSTERAAWLLKTPLEKRMILQVYLWNYRPSLFEE